MIPIEILLLIARQFGPRDLINLARAIPGIDRQYNPKYWLPIRDQDGDTIFHISAAKGLNDVITSLLTKTFDTGLQNDRGMTALHWASKNGHAGTTSLLLRAGIDPNTPTIRGITALNYAVKNGHSDVIRQLISFTEPGSPL